MRERSLAGRTVAALGLGDVSFTRAAARGHDVGEVTRRVHEALEHAIDVIDLAPEPDVERAVGDAVRALRARDRAVVATTIPALAERAGAPTRDTLSERLPARYVQEQVEASLRATRLDGLPLVQLPVRTAWLAATSWPELHGTCERLAREGKVLAWGAIVDVADAHPAATAAPARPHDPFADDPAAALFALPAPAAPSPPPRAHPLAEPLFSSLAIDFSLCARGAAPVLAAAPGHAVLARRPLAGGALAGTLGPGVVLARTDDRRGADLDAIAVGVAKLARFVKRPPPAARASEAARAIAETAARPAHVECETLAELALRYAIDRGALVLPRLHRRDDLHEAIAAAAAPSLSAWTTEQISSIFGA